MSTLETIGNHGHFSFLVFTFILASLRIFYVMAVSDSAFLQEGRPCAYCAGLQAPLGFSV